MANVHIFEFTNNNSNAHIMTTLQVIREIIETATIDNLKQVIINGKEYDAAMPAVYALTDVKANKTWNVGQKFIKGDVYIYVDTLKK